MMIAYENLYFEFIKSCGVGANDTVKDASPRSYLRYLQAVSKILAIVISPITISTDNDVASTLHMLKGKRATHTISNYGSALKKYAEMVRSLHL